MKGGDVRGTPTWWGSALGTALFLGTFPVLSAAAEKSGRAWVARFPGSARVEDLDAGFRGKVEEFIRAAKTAGATVRITSTRRSRERAYLMHWSWRIAKQNYDARRVPAMVGVDMDWWHGNQNRSREKAQEMVNGYGTNHLRVAPSLTSRHVEGKAIDMQITWPGALAIKDKSGKVVKITSAPRGSTNADLIAVGKTYGVIHFINIPRDKVHWSTDGK
jgi:hypothetical protein